MTQEWLPVTGSDGIGGLTEMAGRATCTQPPEADKLGRAIHNEHQLTIDVAAKLNFPIASVGGEYKQRYYVGETKRFAECQADDGTTLQYGVAVRLAIHVVFLSAEFKLQLPVIAAQAQIGNAEARATIIVDGYVGSLGELPGFEPFDVDKYVNLMSKTKELRDRVLEDKANIRPVCLAVPRQPELELDFSVWRVWALSGLAEEASCAEAKKSFPGGRNPARDEIIETLYGELTRKPCEDTPPGEVAVARAREHLQRLRLRD